MRPLKPSVPRSRLLALPAALVLLASAAQAQEDGARLFKNLCSACHSTNSVHRVGPSLVGVVNRPAGAAAGYEYSEAIKKRAVTWDAATLERFLAAPGAVVPGTKMSFPGIQEAEKRQAIIAYLAKL